MVNDEVLVQPAVADLVLVGEDGTDSVNPSNQKIDKTTEVVVNSSDYATIIANLGSTVAEMVSTVFDNFVEANNFHVSFLSGTLDEKVG